MAAGNEESANVITIEAYLGGTFQPGVARGEGLTPLRVAQDLADEWMEIHEGLAVEYIDGPGGEGLAQWIKSR